MKRCYCMWVLLVLLLGVLCDVSFARTCPQCNGKGGTQCGTCFGKGWFNGQQCTSCHGSGIYNICTRCRGTGEIPDGGSENPGDELNSTIAIVKETSRYDAINVGEEYPVSKEWKWDWFNVMARVKGGVSPYTWSVVKGNLPKGLSIACTDDALTSSLLNAGNQGENATIKGIPVRSGTYNFTLQATDANGKSATQDFSITVNGEDIDTTPDPEPEPAPTATITITKAETLAEGTAGTDYSETLTAEISNSSSPIVWSSTDLPSWLKLDASTGRLTGKPTSAGTYSFTVTATSGEAADSRKFTITVQPAQTPAPTVNIKITKNSLASGTAGSSYNDLLTADTSNVTWSVSSGTLPAGLSLDVRTGAITGTPTTAGIYTFTVKAVNGTASDTQIYILTINEAASTAPDPAPAPTISDTSRAFITANSLPNGTVGKYYGENITVSSDVPLSEKWDWSISAGTLPSGLSIGNPVGERALFLTYITHNTCAISGTPTAAGMYTFTITAAYGDTKASKQFTLTVDKSSSFHNIPNIPILAESIIITKSSLASGTTGTSYTDMLTANISGVTWSVSSGSLPEGLALDSSDGTITGTPTSAGTYTFVAKASSGTASATKQYTITISAPQQQTQPLQITQSFMDGTAGTLYDDYVTITGGAAPYTFSTTGSIPPGLALSLSGQNIALNGTPTQAGNYTFWLSLSDSQGATAYSTLTIVISPADSQEQAPAEEPEPVQQDITPNSGSNGGEEAPSTPAPDTSNSNGDTSTVPDTGSPDTTRTDSNTGSSGGGGGGGCNSGIELISIAFLLALIRKH